MLGGLAIRKLESLSSLLIFALVLIFIQQGWVIGLGLCDCYGSCYSTCPNQVKIEQNLWNKEAYEFLHCDDCFQNPSPYNSSTLASNQPVKGTANYWLDKGNNSYLAGSYEQAEKSYAEALRLDPSLLEGWLNRGNALFFLGRYQESLDAYDAALRLEPQNANALQGQIRTLLALNRAFESNSTLVAS